MLYVRIQFTSFLGHNKIFIFLLFLLLVNSTVSADNIDSLFQNFLTKKGSRQIEIANQLSDIFYENEYYVTPIRYQYRGDKDYMYMTLYYGMSCYKNDLNDFQNTTKYAKKSIEYCHKDSLIWLSDNYANISIAFSRMGQFDKAITYAELGYHTDEKIGDEALISSSLNTLAAIYMQNERNEIAENYIKRAIEIERKLDRNKQLSIRLGMYCDILIKLNKTDEALTAIQESIELDRKGNREDKVAIRLSQMGEVFIAQKKWKEAYTCCLEALDIFEKKSAYISIVICLR